MHLAGMPESRSSRHDDQASRELQVKLSREAGGVVSLLSEVVRLVSSSRRANADVQRSLLELLFRELGFTHSAISVVGSSGRAPVVACSRDLSADELARLRYASAGGVLARVLREAEPLVLGLDADSAPPHRTAPAACSGRVFVAVPLRGVEGVLGMLSGELPAASERDTQALALIGSLIAPLMAAQTADVQAAALLSEDFVVSPGLREVLGLAERVAASAAHVLVRGESGVGKECVVRAIRRAQGPAGAPFVAVRCASLRGASLEAEIRGELGQPLHPSARFTLFLDEVTELGPADQAQLVRILDAAESGSGPRVLATTRADLEHATRTGRFRPELFFRLQVFPLDVPPLRERRDDIVPLTQHFLRKYAAEHDKRVTRISDSALGLFGAYDFPGNVRELENCISRAVLLARYGVIRQHHLPRGMQPAKLELRVPSSLPSLLSDHERAEVQAELERARYDRAAAARALGTTPRSLAYRMKKLGLVQDERARGERP